MRSTNLLAVLVVSLTTSTAFAVEIIAHRGASHDAPENTLAAFRLGWEQQADTNELDVQQSQDGRAIVIHDNSTRRTAGLDKLVAEQSLAELQKLDGGEWKAERWRGEKIPTLEEAIATLPATGKRLFIEIKCSAAVLPEVERVIAAAKKQPAQLAIIGFNYETMRLAKERFPNLQVYWIVSYKAAKETGQLPQLDDLVKKAKAAKLDGLDLDWKFPLDRAAVDSIKQAGLKLYCWTVNDLKVARRLADAGIDGITTDRPLWLREGLHADRDSAQ